MGDRSWQSRVLFLFSGLCVFVFIGQTIVSTQRWVDEPFPGFFVYENLTVGPNAVPTFEMRQSSSQ